MPQFHIRRELSSQSINVLTDAFERNDANRTARKLVELARQGHKELLSSLHWHPLADDWRDFAIESLAQYWESRKGWLYIVANPAQRGFYKLGLTRLKPTERLKSLNNEAVVGEFVLVNSFEVHDRFYLESASHKLLEGVPRHKEFFHAHWTVLEQAASKAIADDLVILETAGISPSK